jgi:hypothetical protein
MFKHNVTKLIVALFVSYGSCLCGIMSAGTNALTAAGNTAAAMTRGVTGATTTAARGARMMERGTPIVSTQQGQRDTTGGTMYALPYEEETTGGTMRIQPVDEGQVATQQPGKMYALPVEEPVDTRRPGMMYAL